MVTNPSFHLQKAITSPFQLIQKLICQTQTQTKKFFYSTFKIHNDFKNRHKQIIKTFWVRETSVKINTIIAGTDATL